MLLFRLLLPAALTLPLLSPASAADPAAGAAYFKQHCALCHVVTPGARGSLAPNLFGIGGTMSGVGDFTFSNALKAAKIKWDATTLDTFLAAPSKTVPGTRMITAIPDDTSRRDVVSYLLTLKK